MPKYLTPIFTLFVFIILWEGFVRVAHVDSWILPAPSGILSSFWESKELLLSHTAVTTVEFVTGLFLAVIVGWIGAIIMYFSNFAKKILYPIFIISQTIPFIALAPLLVIWFGFGLFPKIMIVTLVCFFPIVVNLTDGFSSVNKSIIHNMRAIGANRYQIFRLAVVPSSLPYFFSGLRIAGTYALLTAVVAEWLGAANGLGVFMTRASKSYLTDGLFAAIFVVSMISLVTVLIIDQIYKFATPWKTR